MSKDPKGMQNNQRIPDPLKPENKNQFQRGGYNSDGEDYEQFQSDRKFANFILFSGALALGLMFMATNVLSYKKQQDKEQEKKQKIGKVTYTGKADIGGDWQLYDTYGKVVTNKSFEGKYYLIYFGFTLCPDVCPISLNKLAKSMRKVKNSKEYKYFDLETLFVSLDPDRDTNERIRKYCAIFDESIIGLTHKSNDDPELKDILKKFKIHSSKIYLTEEEEEEDKASLVEVAPEVASMEKQGITPKNDKYSLDHTIVSYLIGPDNQFLTYLGSNLNEHEMADIILDEISSDMSKRYGMNKGKGAAPVLR